MLRILAAVLVFLPALAFAESRGTPSCKDGALPFPATSANQLTGARLRQAVNGKRLGYLRESNRTPGVWVNNTRELRADGSMVYTCEFSRSPSGPWRPCTSYGSMENRQAGAHDVGVWSVENDVLCSVHAAFGQRSQDCFTIHRQGATFAARRVSGSRSACLQGTISLQ